MADPDYGLDLDRSQAQPLREQAREAIAQAIRSGRAGFRAGDRLSTLALARQNAIHRNTLASVMADLVRLGYLRRLPNKGFEVVDPAPERPPLLTRHILSLSEVAERNGVETRSELIAGECGMRRAGDLAGSLARVPRDLALAPGDPVAVLARRRFMMARGTGRWDMVAIEQSFIPAGRVPGFLEAARRAIETEGRFSVYRQLRRTFPKDDFFKAHYEISLLPLPEGLAAAWLPDSGDLPPMCVVAITYCAEGPVEFTRTWFDTRRAVLVAGSLEVRLSEEPAAGE